MKLLYTTLVLVSVLFYHVTSLKILFPSPCLTGHLTPSSGIVRALIARGHIVDVFMGDHCCDTKAKDAFGNFSQCFSSDFARLESIDVEDHFKGLMQMKWLFADNCTKTGFQVLDQFLEARPLEYDLVFHDYLILGANLAAKKHKIPVMMHYDGPFTLPLELDTQKPMSLVFLPEVQIPEFVLQFFELMGALMWQKYVSEDIYETVNEIHENHGMEPVLKNSATSYGLPFSYYYMYSPMVHMGPPDVFTLNPEFMLAENNIRHVGYIPDDFSLRDLDPEIEKFIARATNPVVYMSLGTLFQIDVSRLKVLLDDLAIQTKYSVVWSASSVFHDDLKSFHTAGQNVILVRNVAQLALLMDKRVKVFITHAGANSLQEGIFAETPMLVYPGFGDQPINAGMLVKKNLALPLAELSANEILRKIDMMLEPGQLQAKTDALKKSKKLMVSLGGYDKAAEHAEEVYKGKFKVINPPALKNFEVWMNSQILKYSVSVIALVTLVVLTSVRCCCYRKLCCACCRISKLKNE